MMTKLNLHRFSRILNNVRCVHLSARHSTVTIISGEAYVGCMQINSDIVLCIYTTT